MPPVSKIMKMNDAGNTPLAFVSTDHSSTSQQPRITDKALLRSLTTLFRAFDNVAGNTGVVTSDTYFVFNVIEQIVDCGKDTAKPILSNLSSNLVRNYSTRVCSSRRQFSERTGANYRWSFRIQFSFTDGRYSLFTDS